MDILNEMTKKELVEWMRGHLFSIMNTNSLPQKSDLLFLRWNQKVTVLEEKENAHLDSFKSLDFKKRDEYAKRFNATKNIKEKLRLIKKMEPYEKLWKKYSSESEGLRAERKALDRLYNQIGVERKKESNES